MVKIKLTDPMWEGAKQYIGNTYDAFKLAYPDGTVTYHTQIEKDSMCIFTPEECIEVEDEVIETEDEVIETEDELTPLPNPKPDNTEFIKYQKQILFVEDCSIHSDDFDYLVDWCDNHGIKIVIYKRGTNKPEFLGD